MSNKNRAVRLLRKYIEQRTSKKESEQVEEWYASYDELFIGMAPDKRNALQQEIFQGINNRINQKSGRLRPHHWYYRAVAALILISCSVGYLIFRKNEPLKPDLVEHIIQTRTGETRQQRMPDGSIITLSGATRLSFRSDFNGHSRTVRLLSGEAFFKVKHDPSRMFIVRLPHGLYTQVLGTSFTIKSMGDSSALNVLVHTGRIALGSQRQLLAILSRGDYASYTHISHQVSLEKARIKSRTIYFDRLPLSQLIKDLEEEYDVSITLSDSVSARSFLCSGSYETGRGIAEILEDLSQLYQLKMETSSSGLHYTLKMPMKK